MRISDWSSDVCSSDLPVETAEAFIRQRITALRATNSGKAWDPLIHLSLNWLEANIPTNMPTPVIVHGDAGPGNFLFEGEQVTDRKSVVSGKSGSVSVALGGGRIIKKKKKKIRK